MEINIGMSECHRNVDNYYSSNITGWIPCCAGQEAFDGVEPLPEYIPNTKKMCSPKPFWLVSGRLACRSRKTEILNKIGI